MRAKRQTMCPLYKGQKIHETRRKFCIFEAVYIYLMLFKLKKYTKYALRENFVTEIVI